MALDRLGDWEEFSRKVQKHILKYTIPQYQNEDGESDQVGIWTASDCVNAIRRYIGRFDKNSRGEIDQLRDFLKIAHYAQFAYDKYRDEKGLPDVYPVAERMDYGVTK